MSNRTLKALAAGLVLALAAVAGVAYADRTPSLQGTVYQLNGTPHYLGRITATTTKNNHDTAVPFNDTTVALKGMTLLVQCDAAADILPGTVNTATVTTATGVKVAADEKFYIMMENDAGWMAVVGTANCDFWQLL